MYEMQNTVTMRLCLRGRREAAKAAQVIATDPALLAERIASLNGRSVEAATMKGAGVYWMVPFRALADAGIRAELAHARRIGQ